MILLAIAACYAAAVPVVRSIQRKDETLDPARAFGWWLLWPLVLVFFVGMQLARVPHWMFPVPQVTKVKQRLRESAAKKEQQQ